VESQLGRYRGICYFDEEQQDWMILDLQGQLLKRDASPIAEAQTLTVFDEEHCRGADLRLRPDAMGLLTLGPATCKDKLMQVGPHMRNPYTLLASLQD
jgi:hypothetical protein